MVSATAINPGVITSLDGRPGSATQPVQVFPPPDVIPSNAAGLSQQSPLLQTPSAPPASTTVFETPHLTLPDISQIEQQLKATGALISDIPEQAIPNDSPLAHLQPNATEPPTTTNPIYSQPSPVAPLPPIKLASTVPTNNTLVIPPDPASIPEDKPSFFSQLLKWGISGLSVIAVVIMGMMAYQNFVLQDGNASLKTMFTQYASQSDYVEIDEETEQPKAVWYQ
jgi:hypothetical protein